jgi:hypothetical protein
VVNIFKRAAHRVSDVIDGPLANVETPLDRLPPDLPPIPESIGTDVNLVLLVTAIGAEQQKLLERRRAQLEKELSAVTVELANVTKLLTFVETL